MNRNIDRAATLQIPMEAQKEKELLDAGDLFQRPDGKWETADERDKRLAHNARMRFNRSFDSPRAKH